MSRAIMACSLGESTYIMGHECDRRNRKGSFRAESETSRLHCFIVVLRTRNTLCLLLLRLPAWSHRLYLGGSKLDPEYHIPWVSSSSVPNASMKPRNTDAPDHDAWIQKVLATSDLHGSPHYWGRHTGETTRTERENRGMLELTTVPGLARLNHPLVDPGLFVYSTKSSQ